MWWTIIPTVASAIASVIGALVARKHATNASDCAKRAQAATQTTLPDQKH